VFGPDGKLYFNFGNEGKQLKDKNGKLVIDQAGNEIAEHRKPYQQGMVFRCNLDGSEVETLGWNFRNNWEVAVDSFGTLWQSDNDDDGNRGVRINYVMEFGNYGYRDELTGAGWQSPRSNMEPEIPRRHWHLNDPGVVPTLLLTGAGSPTGILVYEGRLLPKVFWDQVIHCDAGPNVVRAYPVTRDGAGYKAEIVNILKGTRDQWFRPSDVCVAPDGSLIVADWYDPGVGGHAMGDLERGRLFRVAPPGAKYEVPKYDYSTPQGAAEALKSPNLCARQVAWTTLHAMQAQAEPALKQAFEDAENPRQRARALWLLGLIPGRAEHYIRVAMNDASPDIRLTAVRLARRVEFDIIPVTRKLLRDPAPQVRRELLIALRHHPSAEKPRLWAELAAQHDGTDRWYLEALGLAADGQWDACLDAYLAKTGPSWNTPAGRDIIWRSRAAKTPSFLTKIMNDPAVPVSELPQYFRAFDFVSGDEKNAALIELAFVAPAADPERQTLIAGEALARLPGFDIQQQPRHAAALLKVLDRLRGTPQFVELVGKFRVAQRYGELLQLAQEQPESQLGADAARQLLALGQLDVLRQAIESPDANTAAATLRALGSAADGRALEIFRPVMDDDSKPLELRRQAVRGVAKTRPGALWLITLAKNGKLRDELKDAAAMELHLASAPDIKTQAEQLFPLPAAKDKLLPPLSELLKLQGDAGRGKIVFETTGTCAKCHVVNGAGKQVGPDLSEIGDKLSRPAFFESILYPSAGISHSYESHTVATKDGDIVTGILTSDTPEAVTLKLQDGLTRTVAKSQIEQMERSKLSMMPADLQKLMSAQDLADVVEYMTTLRKGKK
jgi:putative heme-binding domain-containing protein